MNNLKHIITICDIKEKTTRNWYRTSDDCYPLFIDCADVSQLAYAILGRIGTIVPGLFVKLRQGIYYEIGDEQQSKVRNIVIDW